MYPDPPLKTSGPAQGRGKVIVLALDKTAERIGVISLIKQSK
jgi:hypothetical protein